MESLSPEALEALKFPIGRFHTPHSYTPADIAEWIAEIEAFPALLRGEVSTLDDAQLDTPYRPGGWNLRQVVHHCADSHMNSIIRFKLALTEENPTIRPYHEDRWALLPDYDLPCAVSLQLLEAVHTRWTVLLRTFTPAELHRTLVHPEHNQQFNVYQFLALYAWHCRHHLAHVRSLKTRMNWV